ncbi:cystathionine gamma-lyase, partial [Saccharopolyspora sp. NPDC047091]
MPDKHDPATVSDATWAVHGGNATDASGALRTPLVLANSYLLPEDPSQLSWSDPDVRIYARNGNVNQHALETKLAALDGG